MEKKNIAVVAGGYSSEYVISLRSAEEIANNIDKSLYNVHIIKIMRDSWEVHSNIACGIPINKNDFSFSLNNQKTKFDAVFMGIHGTPGEDGRLQAYFEMLEIPFTTGSTLSLALSFDKFFCNNFLKAQGIKIADSLVLKTDYTITNQEIIDKLALPIFVKPSNAGSSFGISKVNKIDELDEAIKKAFTESSEILIESFIKGRELTAGVFISKNKDFLLPVTEVISKNDFFDYEAKYTPNMSEEITPANIPSEITKEIQNLAKKVYLLLNSKGVARVDFIWTGNEIYFLEINTVPGMSKESIVPKQIREAGYSLKEFYNFMLEDALTKG